MGKYKLKPSRLREISPGSLKRLKPDPKRPKAQTKADRSKNPKPILAKTL